MSNEIIVVPDGVQLTPNSLTFDNGMVIDEWLQLMHTLGCIEDANAWWIGAGLNQGEKIYGELYAQALDESKAKSWRNYKWVENKIKVSSRLDIPWSHHQEAARLEDAKDIDSVLKKAKKGKWSRAKIRAEVKKIQRAKLIDSGAKKEGSKFRLITDDVADGMQQLDKRSIDVIITDPPYPKDFLPLYGVLAEEARRVLKVGGLMVVMIGQSYLPEIIELMSPYLDYHWMASYQAPGASTQLWQRKVLTQWKPLLIFSNGEYMGDWLYDVVKSDRPDKEKHDWGQSESGMADIMKRFSQENDLVLDPFCGAGTTGVVALKDKRRFIGIDVDETQIEIAAGRIAKLLDVG